MTKHQQTWQAFAGVVWIVAALGGHWLITPANDPDATAINFGAAWLQVVGGVALGIWAWRRSRLASNKPAA